MGRNTRYLEVAGTGNRSPSEPAGALHSAHLWFWATFSLLLAIERRASAARKAAVDHLLVGWLSIGT